MSTTATINTAGVFPDGTDVSAYKLSDQPEPFNPANAPSGTADATASVSSGAVAFTGLTTNTRYVAHAEIEDVNHYVAFTTYDYDPGSDTEAFANVSSNETITGEWTFDTPPVGAGGGAQLDEANTWTENQTRSDPGPGNQGGWKVGTVATFGRTAAGVTGVELNGDTYIERRGGGLTRLGEGTAAGFIEVGPGYIQGPEQASDPAAPAANYGRLYFRDNGSGKTQLVARFPTGAVQVIATEP